MHQRWATFIGTAAVAVVALGGCGGDDKKDASAADADLTVLAKDSLEFDKNAYTAPAGELTIAYENDGAMEHTLLVEGVDDSDFKLSVIGSGDTDVGTVRLEPGEYRIYCDVPGHEDMEATLTVE